VIKENNQYAYLLKKHMVSPLNQRNFVCDECGKLYNYISGLSEHKKMKHNELISLQ
jgi:hypothetical protein